MSLRLLRKWYAIIVVIIIILSFAARKLIRLSFRSSGNIRGMTTERTNRRVKASLSTPACFRDQIAIRCCGLQFAVRLNVFGRRIPSVEPRSLFLSRERERDADELDERRAGNQTYRESRDYSHAYLSVSLSPVSVFRLSPSPEDAFAPRGAGLTQYES